jgi:hypothetical protein
VAVKDAASAKVGNAAQLVEVPALDSNKVALSGITLSTDPEAGPTSIANVAMRRFRSSSNLFYGYVVYAGRAKSATEAPGLLAQVKLFREGALVYDGSMTVVQNQLIQLAKLTMSEYQPREVCD